MRKNGFTLIELLAVIVILAIIALIATPIILGIINDAREESNERSVELYASAVRNGIAAYQLREGKEVAAGTYLSKKLPFEVEYDGKVDCTSVIISGAGNVLLDGCTVNNGTKEYNYGELKDVLVNFSDVCTPVTEATKTTGNVPTGNYEIGDEYTCEVKEGTNYTFFVLSKEENKVNLIMDSNININGEAVKETAAQSELGLIEWLIADDYIDAGGIADEDCQIDNFCTINPYGPITAIKHLQVATKDWEIGSLIINSFDDDTGKTYKMLQTMISPARMPSKTEVEGTGCATTRGSCPLWMANYTAADPYSDATHVAGIEGYWTTTISNSYYVLNVDAFGYLSSVNSAGSSSYAGVRPVISLKI